MDIAALFLGFLAGIAAVLVFALVIAARAAGEAAWPASAAGKRADAARRVTAMAESRGAVSTPPKRNFDAPAANVVPLRKPVQPTDGDAA